MDKAFLLQIHLKPLPPATFGAPPRPDALVHRQLRRMTINCGGYRYRLAVGKEHILRRDLARVEFPVRHGYGVVGKVQSAIEQTVLVQSGRKQTHAALKIPVHADAHSCHVPEIAERVLNGTTVTCTLDKAAKTHTERRVGGVGKGTEGGVANIVTVGIDWLLRCGTGVLEVIFTVPFVHIRSFQEGFAGTAEIVPVPEAVREVPFDFGLAGIVEALPAMAVLVFRNKPPLFPDGGHGFPIQLHAPDGLLIAAAPV